MIKSVLNTASGAAGERELTSENQQRQVIVRLAYCTTLFFVAIISTSLLVSVDVLPIILAFLPCLICLMAVRYGFITLAKTSLLTCALAFASVLPSYLGGADSSLILLASCIPLPFLLFSNKELKGRGIGLAAIILTSFLVQLISCPESANFLFFLNGQPNIQGTDSFNTHVSIVVQMLALMALAVFVYVLAKKHETASAHLYRSEQKLEAVITSLNDVVFEVDSEFRILNVWCSDDQKLPSPRHLYENTKAKDILTEELYEKYYQHVDVTLQTGEKQTFEYLSPTNGRYYEVNINRLSSMPNEGARLAISLRDISDQQKVRRRLAIQNRFVEKHWDSLVYTDMQGNVSFANEVTYSQNALKPNSLNGKHISLLLGDKKYLVDVVLSELDPLGSWQGETTLVRSTGEEVRISLSVMLLHDDDKQPFGLAWSMRDITDVKKAERMLRISEKRFKSMAVNAPGIIYEWYTMRDGSGWGFNYISPRVEEILGLEPGKCLADVNEMMQYLHPDDQESFANSVFDVTNNLSGWNHVSRLVLPDNDTRWIRGISTPIDCTEQKVVFHGILMDITQQVLSQEELLRAKERAEVAIKEKSNFLSTMSHEIRTPLNAVIGLSHLLLEEEPNTEQIENLKTLKFSAENLLGLINDILDFSKIEAGKIELEKIPVSLGLLIRGIVSSFEFQANDKSIDLRKIIDPNLPEMVLADPIRLSQVLNNLLSNAIKFTEKGFVEIKLAVKRLLTNQVTVEFRIKDSGIGIEEDKQTAIFEFFNQADNSVTRRYGGTGLGLAITRGILQLHQTEIKLVSAPGEGAIFSFTIDFPIALNESKVVTNLPDAGLEYLKGARILLVEDNKVNVLVASKLLRKWGAEIDVANDGKDALRAVQESEYDIVLMDIQMPVMDGYEATRAIRKLNGKYSKLPIIALTATVIEEVQRRTKEVGLDGILSKPIKPGELKSELVRYIQ